MQKKKKKTEKCEDLQRLTTIFFKKNQKIKINIIFLIKNDG